jgi:hypothetical protein
MDNYAEPAPKNSGLSSLLLELTESKTGQEAIAETIAGDENQSPGAMKMARALKRSCRIMAEDGAREAGFMIPGCKASRDLIESLTGE